MIHELKTDPKFFQDVLDYEKTFELRYNDRDYKVGDKLLLKETKYSGEEMRDGNPLGYTGREIWVFVGYIMDSSAYGLPNNFVIMSIIFLTAKGV